MADATIVERLARAVERAEMAAIALKTARERETARTDAALAAGDRTLAALDALLAEAG